MIVLGLENICLSFGVKDILKDISFSIEEGDKVGLIGVNGAGKTSLFRILTGEQSDFTGSVYLSRNKTIGALNQNITAKDEESTVYEYVKKAYSHIEILNGKINDAEHALQNTSGDIAELEKLLDTHHRLLAEFEDAGGHSYEGRIKSSLLALNFSESDFRKQIKYLSGGQKTRVGLLRLFLSEPDILLLDEPTNHIDINSIEWLEEFLRNYKKTVVVISHDRYFLDNITNKIIELENTSAELYSGNYTAYVNKKESDRELQERRYVIQQREIKRIEETIARLRLWGSEKKLNTAKSKEKQLEKMDKVEKVDRLPDKINLRFNRKYDRFYESGNDVLTVKELAKSYPDKPLFSGLSFEVKKKDYLFIIGENGTGKSTLLKILTHNLYPDKGTVYWGYNTNIAYYDQEHQNLTEENNVLNEIWNDFPDLTQTEVRTSLGSFLFRNDDIEKLIKNLSGGERARLTILKLILSKPNVLILDEPTNHLDINSREALEKALADFKGTLICVSHDRYFIKKLASRIVELNKNSYMDYKHDYESFLRYKQKITQNIDNENIAAEKSPENRKKTFEEEKEIKRNERKLLNIETEIKKREDMILHLKESLNDEDVYSDYVRINEIYEEIDGLETEIEELYNRIDI